MVVVDLDDTLYLERDYVFSGFAAVEEWATAQGIPGLGLRCAELFREGVRGSVFDQALIAVGQPVDRGVVKELVDVYRKHRPDITQLEPDAADFLERRSEDGVRLAMITGGPVESQKAKVAALQLAPRSSRLSLPEAGERISTSHTTEHSSFWNRQPV
ncbi:MAG: haloacid dehalogenase-like hydrolase [Candidatus Nanopelagicales bacterium]